MAGEHTSAFVRGNERENGAGRAGDALMGRRFVIGGERAGDAHYRTVVLCFHDDILLVHFRFSVLKKVGANL